MGKNKRIVAIAIVSVLLLVAIGTMVVVYIYPYLTRFDNSITSIEKTANNIGGVTSTNYTPIIAEKIDWTAISDGDREALARAAVNQAIETASNDGITTYTVTGLDHTNSKVLFLYTGDNTISLFVDDQVSSISLDSV